MNFPYLKYLGQFRYFGYFNVDNTYIVPYDQVFFWNCIV